MYEYRIQDMIIKLDLYNMETIVSDVAAYCFPPPEKHIHIYDKSTKIIGRNNDESEPLYSMDLVEIVTTIVVLQRRLNYWRISVCFLSQMNIKHYHFYTNLIDFKIFVKSELEVHF